MPYRIKEITKKRSGRKEYRVQKRLLFIFWITATVEVDFGIYGDAIYSSFEYANYKKEELEHYEYMEY